MKILTIPTTWICAAVGVAMLAGCKPQPSQQEPSNQSSAQSSMKPTLVKFEVIQQPEIVVVGKLIRSSLNDIKAGKQPWRVLGSMHEGQQLYQARNFQ